MTESRDHAIANPSLPIQLTDLPELGLWHDGDDMRGERLSAVGREALGNRVSMDPVTKCPVFASRDDVREVLGNYRRFGNYLTLAPWVALDKEVQGRVGKLLDDMGPANTAAGDGWPHAEAREAINKTFHMSDNAAYEHYGTIVEEEIDGFIERIQLEMLSNSSPNVNGGASKSINTMPFIWELPLAINSRIIGFPREWHERLKKASLRQIALVWGNPTKQEQLQGVEGLEDLLAMSKEQVARTRELIKAGNVPNNFTSALLQFRNKEGQALDDKKIAQIIMNFAVAGHETTTNSLANGLRFLLESPGEWWQKLVDDPSQIKNIVEELLRLEASIVAWYRVAFKKTEVGGVEIPAGQRVIALLATANRDEDFYQDPESFRPGRKDRQMVTFGVPAKRHQDNDADNSEYDPRLNEHYCPGAGLARVVMRACLQKLSQEWPGLRLDTSKPARYARNLGFRSLQELYVQLQLQD
jgi:cytochrome P450